MKTKFLYFILIILSEFVFSQNPVTFETQVNSLGEDKFELVTNATIEKGWRLYSQNLPKGGAIPTEFIFDNFWYSATGWFQVRTISFHFPVIYYLFFFCFFLEGEEGH